MSRYQYRLRTGVCSTSFFGNAYLAIYNPPTSGRRLVIRDIELDNETIPAPPTAAAGTLLQLVRCGVQDAINTGVDHRYLLVPHNSANPIHELLYDYVNVFVDRSIYVDRVFTEINTGLGRRVSDGQSNMLRGMHVQTGARRLSGSMYRKGRIPAVEPRMVAEYSGERLALYVPNHANPSMQPMRVSVELRIAGHGYTLNTVIAMTPGLAPLVFEGNNIELIDVSLSDLGSTDTPTLRVVPIGALRLGDTEDYNSLMCNREVLCPVDSANHDSMLTDMKLLRDVSILPSGVPEQAVSQGSFYGGPKDYNYLHTRDFNGPTLRTILVEGTTYRPSAQGRGDAPFAMSHKGCSIMGPASDLTLMPGEGIAIVNSVEMIGTAFTASQGGWPQFRLSATIDSMPSVIPELILKGYIWTCEVRVYKEDGSNSLGVEVFGTESNLEDQITVIGELDAVYNVQVMTSGYVEYNARVSLSRPVTELFIQLAADPFQ